MSNEKLEAVANANAHLQNAGLPTVDQLLVSLAECLNYIEHKAANEGKATTDAEWDANVLKFRTGGISRIGIGRSYLDKAAVDLGRARELLTKARIEGRPDPMIVPTPLHA